MESLESSPSCPSWPFVSVVFHAFFVLSPAVLCVLYGLTFQRSHARPLPGPVAAVNDKDWSSHERVHVIQSLPALSPQRMAELDARFHFNDSGYYEVLSAWLEKAIDAGYKEANPAIERFLTVQGRRKFLKPIYEKLARTPETMAFAKRIYEKARPTYHPVSRDTIDEIMASGKSAK